MTKRVCYKCLRLATPVPVNYLIDHLSKENSVKFKMCPHCKRRTFFSESKS